MAKSSKPIRFDDDVSAGETEIPEGYEKKELIIPLQPKQRLFEQVVESGRHRYPLYGGAKGGGKSHVSRILQIKRRMHYPNTTGLLIRRNLTQVRRNHILPLFQQFPFMRQWYNATDKEIRFPNGSLLMFGHADSEDDIFNYSGIEFDDVAVEEATEFTEMQKGILMQANRPSFGGKVAIKEMGFRPCCWFTGNPGGIGHGWAKRLWIDEEYEDGELAEDYYFIQALVTDNKALLEADPQYVRILESYKNIDPMLYEAYRNGNWEIYAGQFFTEWRRNKVEIPEPFYIPTNWPLFGAMDFGTSAPTSFGLYTVRPADNKLIRLFGYYEPGTIRKHAETILDRVKKFHYTLGRLPSFVVADPSMWTRIRKDEETIDESPASIMQENWPFELVRANNDRQAGWHILKDRLANNLFGVIAKYNDEALRHMPEIPRDRHNIEDLDTHHKDDHIADEIRYACMHVDNGSSVEEDTYEEFLEKWDESIKRPITGDLLISEAKAKVKQKGTEHWITGGTSNGFSWN